MGCLVGDALGVGAHWYYDVDVLRQEFGWIDGYTKPKPGRYHEGQEAGDLSQTGQVSRAMSECIGPPPAATFFNAILSSWPPVVPHRCVSCFCAHWRRWAGTTRTILQPDSTVCWALWMAVPTLAATQTWRCGTSGAAARHGQHMPGLVARVVLLCCAVLGLYPSAPTVPVPALHRWRASSGARRVWAAGATPPRGPSAPSCWLRGERGEGAVAACWAGCTCARQPYAPGMLLALLAPDPLRNAGMRPAWATRRGLPCRTCG